MANTKIPSELIADSSITAAKLADGTITTADIADSNVTTAKIADSNVTTAKIGDAQVTTAKITDANVTTGKIADDAVTTAKMASNSVTSDTIASGIALAGTVTAASHVQIAGNLDVVGQIAAYNNPGSSWGSMNFRASDYYFKNSGGTVKASLDSSGNFTVNTGHVLIGKTSTAFGTAGISLRSEDVIQATRSAEPALEVNRLSTDGEIAGFYKDSARIGSIGVSSGSMYIEGNPATGKVGLTLFGSSIEPRDAGSASNGAVDLGATGSRFKDAHFSGTVSANTYAHDGDSDTYFNFPSANQLSLVGGGAEIVRAYQIAGAYGVLRVNGSGSATYPNFTFNGDDNTGMYRAGTDTLAFTTAGTERMRIDSAGTMFLGTSTPTLHSATRGIVFENGSIINDVTRGAGKSITLAQNLVIDSGNTWAYLATDEGSYYQQFGGNHYFGTTPSGSAGADATVTTRMFIANTGSVGIGTTSPGARLHIKAVNNRTGLTGTGLGTLHIDDGDTPSNNEVTSITMGGYTTNALGIIGLQTTNNGSKLFFGTSNNYSAGVSNTAMTINYDGKVGIGTASPDAKLTVNGAANSEQVIITGNNNQSRGLSILTAATGGQQDAKVIFNAQDTENVAYPAIQFETGGTEKIRVHHKSTIFSNRVGLNYPSELMFNGEYNAGQQDVAVEAGHAARIEFLKDDFFRIQGSASVSAGAGVSYTDKLKVNIDSGGILFGSDTAAANTLDDYEEGTWTPTITFGGGSTGQSYNRRQGKYIKIGSLVYIQGHLYFTNKGSSTGQAGLAGLPFPPSSNSSGTFSPLGDRGQLNTGGRVVSCYLQASTTTFPLYDGGFDGSGNSDTNYGDFNNSTEIDVNFCYYTDA